MSSRPSDTLRCFFVVDAENDATVAARLLQVFTVRGENPEWFSLRKLDGERLRISIDLDGLDETQAHQISNTMLRIPAVIDVTCSSLISGDALAA